MPSLLSHGYVSLVRVICFPVWFKPCSVYKLNVFFRKEFIELLLNGLILYFIIVREVVISESIAARGLKFGLQVALSGPIATPWTQIRKSGSGSGKTGFCPEIFFRFFRFYGPLGTSGSLPGGSRTT